MLTSNSFIEIFISLVVCVSISRSSFLSLNQLNHSYFFLSVVFLIHECNIIFYLPEDTIIVFKKCFLLLLEVSLLPLNFFSSVLDFLCHVERFLQVSSNSWLTVHI